jgi:integrase/recombinase XerD
VRDLLESWAVHLRAERKSPQTLRAYRIGVTMYLDYCQGNGLPEVIDRNQVREWIAELLEGGAAAGSATVRLSAVKIFTRWLYDEGEIEADPLIGIKPPKNDESLIHPLSESEIKALIGVCKGTAFIDRRDEAAIRFLLETGVRASELVNMTVADVDNAAGIAEIIKGKGGKSRRVSYGPQTARAVDRYLRARRGHKLAREGRLWLGGNARGFGYGALWQMIRTRGLRAGIEDLHPHRLRHTLASRWLEAGGSEGGLMSQAGWSQRKMIDHYSKATAATRSNEEAKKLNLGDL